MMHCLNRRSAASADVARNKPPLLIHYAENDERVNAGGAAYQASTGGSSLGMALCSHRNGRCSTRPARSVRSPIAAINSRSCTHWPMVT